MQLSGSIGSELQVFFDYFLVSINIRLDFTDWAGSVDDRTSTTGYFGFFACIPKPQSKGTESGLVPF